MTIELSSSIADLQAKKSPLETYQSFYELYNPNALESRGFSTMLSRVLKVGEADDSTHVIVAKREIRGARILPIRHMRDHNQIPYDHYDVKVAVTNGETIAEYDALSIYGIQRVISGKLRPRKLGPEQMHIKFLTDEGSIAGRTEFDRTSQEGTFTFGNRIVGTILGAVESFEIRQSILAQDPLPQNSVAS